MSEIEYRCIGKGFCGSVWASTVDKRAMKREDGGPGRSLRNDWEMHNIISNSLKSVTSQTRFNMIVPQPHAFIPIENDEWWSERASRFPPGFSHCNTLISTRIPPLPAPVRERIIDRYCPPALSAKIKANLSDEDCLVRPYLGRRRIGQRTSRFQVFTLRNFPLHVDQMEELGMDTFRYTAALADALAMMHWVAQVDANDVEFVLASYLDHNGHGLPSPFYSNFLGSHALWILDFDCCHPMSMDEAGVSQAVSAFFKNDPFFPRPNRTADIRDQRLWTHFRNQFLNTSAELLGESSLKNLPQLFIDRLETV
ncbi:hypothetical protein EV356DRAFT_444216 [Viridothelium virens]|uniref:DUF3669 domain-containing protein n=1 Tax=Viridothelium virens TaxID=1048519 RepID=A0A6A6HDJ7_VIRVR|nr:hypothetical protein EV356DRAFT_444216 [Viridothelium virens]